MKNHMMKLEMETLTLYQAKKVVGLFFLGDCNMDTP